MIRNNNSKPYSYRELSDVMCANRGCTRLIKKSILERLGRNRKDLFCYVCNREDKRKIRNARR